MNDTIRKFGFPDTLIHEYEHWVVLLRPQQVTLGSLILASKEPARQFHEVSPAGFEELGQAVNHIEHGLKTLVAYDKLNYLMLMMVDPDVHFHVIPRYEQPADFGEQTFTDHGWPGPPALGEVTATDAGTNDAIISQLKQHWARA
jgi:diadenosine tetraphosphate (Ap4A) HIT family hydrolase